MGFTEGNSAGVNERFVLCVFFQALVLYPRGLYPHFPSNGVIFMFMH